MKRRSFLTTSAVGVAGSLLAAPAIAQEQPKVTWRMASSYPKSLDTIYGASEELSKAVSEMTDGKFEIQVYAAGELLPPLGVLDGVGENTVEMGHTASYFYIGKDTTFAFGTALPWTGNVRSYQAWMYRGGGNDLYNDFLAPYNVHHLPGGNTGTQMAGWYRNEIKSVEDLKGLKMRIGGLGGTLLARLGLIPQQLGAGDIYPSLERGVIDAAEFVGPYDDEKLGFVKVAPYYYYPGLWEGYAELSYFINKDRWEELPLQFKSALSHAAKSTGLNQLNKYDQRNAEALKRLINDGAQLRAYPEDILKASYRESRLMYKEMSEINPNFKKFYENYSAFLEESNTYSSITDMYNDYMQYLARQQGWDKI